jgi:hypothetical protein
MKFLSLMLILALPFSAMANCQTNLEKNQGPSIDEKFWAYHHCSPYSRAVANGIYSENAIVGAFSFLVGIVTIFPRHVSLRDEVRMSCERLGKFGTGYARELSRLSCEQLREVRVTADEVNAVSDKIASCTQDGWNGLAMDDFERETRAVMTAALRDARRNCR